MKNTKNKRRVGPSVAYSKYWEAICMRCFVSYQGARHNYMLTSCNSRRENEKGKVFKRHIWKQNLTTKA